MARAIWKGRLVLGELAVPVKLYSAVEDRAVHFRLLHAPDKSPVKQRLIRKDTGEEVARESLRKAYPLDADTLVVLRADELEAIEPEPSRDIELCRFVDPSLLDDRWYERPYYLGPDADDQGYFALAEALERRGLEGVARWAMRKRRYLGALRAREGYLMLMTLRRADQVLSVSGIQPPPQRMPDEKEIRLAEQLVGALAEDFDPEAWHNEHRERVWQLIEAKARGEVVRFEAPRRERPEGSLADALKQSLRTARESHHA